MTWLQMPPFETSNIQRNRKRDISMEESAVEISLANISIRKVEYITDLSVRRNESEGLAN